MDRWTSLKLKMEKALEIGNLDEALYHLDALIINASSPSDVPNLLSNHTVKDLPTFHYLARFPFREESIPKLEKLIRIFTVSGYDINQILDPPTRQRTTQGVTALLQSIEQKNVILVDCLLRQGARANIRDPEDLTPCHWAIKKNNLKCLETLLEHGGSELVTSASICQGWDDNHVLPLLHQAVNEGHLEIVLYLLSKEDLGVDLNAVACHFKYPADAYMYQEGYEPWRDPNPIEEPSLDDYESGFTPLGRALDLNDIPIIQALVNHPGANPSRFGELHSSLKDGDTEKALGLLKYFSDEELSTDKIDDQWAPHSIHPLTFQSKFYMKFTKTVILEYVTRGWDPNSESTARRNVKIHFGAAGTKVYTFTKYTLLHLACLYKSQEIIKLLVEDLGVDINRKMEGEGNIRLTPLQILLVLDEGESAEYLIEKGADLNLRGDLGILGSSEYGKYLRFMRKNAETGQLELNSNLNAVEIMLRMGYWSWRWRPLLDDQLLVRPDVVLHGTNEFHLALEGGNRDYIRKILECCAEKISQEDLSWVTFCGDNGEEPEKVSSLIWLLERPLDFFRSDWDNVDDMTELVKLMAQLGCDLNTSRRKGPFYRLHGAPLLFYILTYDFHYRTSNRLLKTILQFDRFKLNVSNETGLNPVDYILNEWDDTCCYPKEKSMCWKNSDLQHPPIVETVKLLVTHGLDVSEVVIGAEFRYHRGFNVILKMLHSAGTKISEKFFTSANVCQWSSRKTDELAKEIVELKEWKQDFDRDTGISLKRICGLRVRKLLKCIGDLKMLDELPRDLKETVLGTSYGPSLSQAVSDSEAVDEFEKIENDYNNPDDDQW